MLYSGSTSGSLAATADSGALFSNIVALVLGLLIFAGIIKCVMILRRQETNTLCVLSLMFVLIGWLLSTVCNALRDIDNLSVKVIIGILLFLICGLFLTSLILGIVGLIQYAVKKGRWVQGRGQAIWGISLSSLMLLIFIGGALTAAVNKLQELDSGIVHKISRIDAPEIGVSVNLPSGPWHTWESVAEDDPNSSASAFYGQYGAISVITIPLKDINPTDRDLITVLTSAYGFDYPSKEITDAGPIETDGTKGFALDARRVNEDTEYIYHIRVLRNQYRAYMLVGWVTSDDEKYLPKIRDAMDRFRFAEPTQDRATMQRLVEAESYLLNEIGLRAYNDGRYELAEAAFRSAMKTDPSYYLYAENTIHALENQGRAEEARLFTEQHLDDYQDEPAFKANYAFQLGQIEDRYEQAIELYKVVFDTDYEDEDYFVDYIQTFRALDRTDEAVAALEEYEAKHENQHFTLLRSWLLCDQEKYDEAIALIHDAAGQGPFDETLHMELASIHIDADQDRQAIAVIEDLIERGYTTARVYYLKGEAELGLSWYRRAKSSFAKSYELQKDDSTKEYLDYVSSILGEGDNTLVRSPIDPVTPPADVKNAIADLESRDWQPPQDADTYDLSYIIGYHYEKNEPLRITTERVIKINNRAGIESYSTLEFEFDAQAEKLYVNNVQVRDADGKLLATGDLEAYYTVDTHQDEMGTDDKKLVVPVPGLVAGCELSFQVTTETLADYDSFPFKRSYAIATQPRRYWLLYVSGDVDTISYHDTGAYEYITNTPEAKAWAIHNAPLYVWEVLQPPLSRWIETLTLNDASASWPELGREYLEKIEDRLPITEDVTKLVSESFQTATDDEQKTDRLAAYVRDNISYTAIEFGSRGRMPNATDQTLTNKYGDCKDHALLLWQLLTAAGIKAHLALVDTDNELMPELPSLDQFNHMVVYVPDINGGQFLDCTSKYCPMVGTIPPGLANMWIFVLDPDNPRLIKTDETKPADNHIQSDSVLQVTADGDVHIQQTLTMRGWKAGYMRQYFEPDRPEERLRYLQSLLQSYAPLRLTSLDIEHLHEADNPLIVKMNYQIDRMFDLVDGHLIGRLPALWERYYFEPVAMATRTTPFTFEEGLTMESRISITPPDGWRFEAARPEQSQDSPYFTHRFTEKTEQHRLLIDTKVSNIPGIHPPQDYEGYASSAAQMLRDIRGPIRIYPPDSKP